MELEDFSFNFSDPSDQEIEKAANCFREHGFIILRSAFDYSTVSAISNVSQQLLTHLENLSDRERWNLPPCYNVVSGNSSPSLIALNDWLVRKRSREYLPLEMIEQSHASKLLKKIMCENVVCTLFHSRMRLQRPSQTTARKIEPKGWHQDGGVGHEGACTLWLPLTHCDENYPGLSVYPKNLDAILGERISDEELTEHVGDMSPISALLQRGDGLLFSDRVAHATDMRNTTATKERISIDMRFFDPSTPPPSSKKHPVAELRNFTREESQISETKNQVSNDEGAANEIRLSVPELLKRASVALESGDSNECVRLRSLVAKKNLTDLRAKGRTGGLMMNAIPKSGSKFVRKVLLTTLGLEHEHVISGHFPDKIYNAIMMPECAMKDCIMQGHAGASIFNLVQLSHYFDRLVVHVRDPRQSILSLVHYFDFYRENRPESLLFFKLPKNFFDLPFPERLDWGINVYGPIFANWIEGWIEADENPNFYPKILFTDFNDLVDDKITFFKSIVDFYEVGHRYDESLLEGVDNVNYRKGDTEEWRSAMSEHQADRLTHMIPEKLFDRFNWHR